MSAAKQRKGVQQLELKTMDQTYFAQTYARFDLEAASGKGAVCIDTNGRDYIDFTAGIGVNSLGWCDSDWTSAVSRQAGTLQHTSNLYYSEPMERLGKTLCQRTDMKKVFLCNSGAEANEGLIKLARKYSVDHYGKGRHTILSLENSFHGRTVTTLSATGQDIFHQYYDPFSEGFRFVKANDAHALHDAVDETVCAILVELVQGEGGVVPLEEDFVAEIAEICRKKDILLMVDEVQTGMGRTGKLLCSEHYGIQPDLISLAKGLGGGLPIGAVLIGEKCADTLQFGDHGTTFGGNPVVCAGANVVLDKLTHALLDKVTAKGRYITEQVLQMPHVKSVQGKGLMLGITLDNGYSSKQLVAECLKHGLMILTAKEKLRMLPPLTISYEEIDTGLNRLNEVLSL